MDTRSPLSPHAVALCGALLAGAAPAFAADPALRDHDGAAHGMRPHEIGTGFTPELGGEYAFATIAEIVNALLVDPDTDWSHVDIGALREHLRDMSRVTLETEVVTEPIRHGAAFLVTADDPGVVESAQRMARDHAATMGRNVEGVPGLHFSAEPIEHGVRVEVVGSDEGDGVKVRALGFHGVLALGDHHRRHHVRIATGDSPH